MATKTKTTTKTGKKLNAPMGEAGVWGPSSMLNYRLADGTVYNPEKISIATFRKMRNDYQINACLNVLTFTIQKIDWYVDGGVGKVNKHVDYALKLIWNDLVRGMTKSFWSGYSPMVKVFTHDKNGMVIYKRIKDLAPETCRVNINKDTRTYDGFTQVVTGGVEAEKIGSEISLWYPNEMEDGNYYGRSRLVAAYDPWFRSQIIHLFANRYYERFGEPLVLGKAPNQDIADNDGNTKNGLDVMQSTVTNLKSHSSATIPSDVDDNGNPLYDIKYIESQMRGVDFETYLKRQDMEKARAIFIPDLLLGTGNVGSYELGKEHKSTFLNGLMGTFDEMVHYINRYIIPPLVHYNFGEKATVPEFKYLPISRVNDDLIMNVVTAMVNGKMIRPSTKELSDKIGIPLEEIENTTQEPTNNENNIPIPVKKNKNDVRQEIVKNQLMRLENSIRKAIDDSPSSEKQYQNLENLKLGYMGKIFDRLGDDVGHEFYEKQKKVVKTVCDLFMQRKSVEEIIESAQKVFAEGESLAVRGDFVNPDKYMPEEVKKLDIVYQNLFRDTFRETYNESGNINVSQTKAEKAVNSAYNEKFGKFVLESDFIDPNKYMPEEIKKLPNKFKVLFRDEFKRVYEETRKTEIAEKQATDSVMRAYNEKIKQEIN